MQAGELLAQGAPGGQERSHEDRQARVGRDQLLDARLELGAADDPDLQAEVAQGAAQLAPLTFT